MHFNSSMQVTSKFFNFKLHRSGSFSFSWKTLNITNNKWTQCGLVQVQLWKKRTSELCVETERLEVNRFKTMGWSFRAIYWYIN